MLDLELQKEINNACNEGDYLRYLCRKRLTEQAFERLNKQANDFFKNNDDPLLSAKNYCYFWNRILNEIVEKEMKRND